MSEIPEGGIWTQGIPMPEAKTAFGCAVADGKIYCIGGSRNSYQSGALSTVDVFDIKQGIWSTGTEMPTPRTSTECVVVGHKIYCFGGLSGSSCLSTVEIYDIEKDSWSTGQSMIIGVRHFAALHWKRKIYCIGGATGSMCITDVQVYDTETDSWSTAAPYPVVGTIPSGTVISDKFYCMGGNNWSGTVFYDDLCIYDAPTDTWTKGASLLQATSLPLVCTSGHKIYCLGGATAQAGGGNANDYMQIYNIETDTWSYGAPILDPRWLCNGVVYQNKIYCIGGDDNRGNATSQVDIYTFAYAVTVQYHDENGNPVQSEVVEVVEPGDDFTTSAPAIPGYTCTGYSIDGGMTQNGTTVSLNNVLADHTVTFIYRKDSDNPGTTDPDQNDCCKCCCPCVHIHGNGISVNNLHIHCGGKDMCIDLNQR